MADLFRECDRRTAVETLGDWKRVMLGRTNAALPGEERRTVLNVRQAERFSRQSVVSAARLFGLEVTGIEIPFHPGFCGFARCGADRAAPPAAYSVLFISAGKPGVETGTVEFEAAVKTVMPQNYMPCFFYHLYQSEDQ